MEQAHIAPPLRFSGRITLYNLFTEQKEPGITDTEQAWRIWISERLEDRDIPEGEVRKWALGLTTQGFRTNDAYSLEDKDFLDCGIDKIGVRKTLLKSKGELFQHPVKKIEQPAPPPPVHDEKQLKSVIYTKPPKRSKKPRWYIITFLESLFTKTSGDLFFHEGEWYISTNGQRYPYKGHLKLSAYELFTPPEPKPTLYAAVTFQRKKPFKITFKVKEQDPLRDDVMLKSELELQWQNSDFVREIISMNGKVTFNVRVLMYRNDEW